MHTFVEQTYRVEAPDPAELSAEERRIRTWRREQFRRLGFGLVEAAMMASASVDLAQARRVVALGCPLPTAARILL